MNSKLQESDRRVVTLTLEVNSRLAEVASLNEQSRKLEDSATGAEAKRAASEADRANLNRKLVEIADELATSGALTVDEPHK